MGPAGRARAGQSNKIGEPLHGAACHGNGMIFQRIVGRRAGYHQREGRRPRIAATREEVNRAWIRPNCVTTTPPQAYLLRFSGLC